MLISEQDKKDIKWACQAALLEMSAYSENREQIRNFVLNEATYEQLLNLTHNAPNCYTESSVIELFIVESLAESLGRKLVLEDDQQQEPPKKKSSKLKTAAKIGAGAVGGAMAVDAYKTAKGPLGKVAGLPVRAAKAAYRYAQGGEAAQNLRTKAAEAMKNAKDKGNTEEYRKAASSAAKSFSQQADNLKRFKHARSLGKGALVGGALVTAYLIYKKMRNSGKSEAQAAQAAASAAKTPQEKAKWQQKAQQARTSGK